MMGEWTGWALLLAAVVHIGEEYCTGWPAWAWRSACAPATGRLVIFYALFLSCCLLALLYPLTLVTLSLAALLVINALMHVVSAVRLNMYTPGVYSAVCLLLPLGVSVFCAVLRRSGGAAGEAGMGMIAGLVMLLTPFLWCCLSNRRTPAPGRRRDGRCHDSLDRYDN